MRLTSWPPQKPMVNNNLDSDAIPFCVRHSRKRHARLPDVPLGGGKHYSAALPQVPVVYGDWPSQQVTKAIQQLYNAIQRRPYCAWLTWLLVQ